MANDVIQHVKTLRASGLTDDQAIAIVLGTSGALTPIMEVSSQLIQC